jgi:hypothetical protein
MKKILIYYVDSESKYQGQSPVKAESFEKGVDKFEHDHPKKEVLDAWEVN